MPLIDPKGWGELSLGIAAVVAIAWVATKLIDQRSKSSNPDLARVIQDNTAINSRLVTVVENQTHMISELVKAVHELIGWIKGGMRDG